MSQSPLEGMLPVTQVDREAAAYLHACEYGSATPGYDWILAGECDEEPHVQEFARHRLAAEARTRDAEDLLRRWVAWHKDGGDGDALVSMTLATLSLKADRDMTEKLTGDAL